MTPHQVKMARKQAQRDADYARHTDPYEISLRQYVDDNVPQGRVYLGAQSGRFRTSPRHKRKGKVKLP